MPILALQVEEAEGGLAVGRRLLCRKRGTYVACQNTHFVLVGVVQLRYAMGASASVLIQRLSSYPTETVTINRMVKDSPGRLLGRRPMALALKCRV